METVTYKIKLSSKRKREDSDCPDRPCKKQKQVVKITLPSDQQLSFTTSKNGCLNIVVTKAQDQTSEQTSTNASSPALYPDSFVDSGSSDSYQEVDPQLTQVLPKPQLVLGHCTCCPDTHGIRDFTRQNNGQYTCPGCQNNYRVRFSDLIALKLISIGDTLALNDRIYELYFGANDSLIYLFGDRVMHYSCYGEFCYCNDFNTEALFELQRAEVFHRVENRWEDLATLIENNRLLIENHIYNNL